MHRVRLLVVRLRVFSPVVAVRVHLEKAAQPVRTEVLTRLRHGVGGDRVPTGVQHRVRDDDRRDNTGRRFLVEDDSVEVRDSLHTGRRGRERVQHAVPSQFRYPDHRKVLGSRAATELPEAD